MLSLDPEHPKETKQNRTETVFFFLEKVRIALAEQIVSGEILVTDVISLFKTKKIWLGLGMFDACLRPSGVSGCFPPVYLMCAFISQGRKTSGINAPPPPPHPRCRFLICLFTTDRRNRAIVAGSASAGSPDSRPWTPQSKMNSLFSFCFCHG